MRAIVVALLAGLVISCGGDPEPQGAGPSASREVRAPANQPPIIRSVQILPLEPSVGDTLTLVIKSMDPDGDRLDIGVDWLRNGQPVEPGAHTTLQTQGFARGDRMEAIVYVSDGEEEVVARAPAIQLLNQTPRITRLRLLPENPHAGTDLVAVAEARDGDGDSFEFSYEWFVNGRPVANHSGESLPEGRFRRGDEVYVSVVASDPYESSESVESGVLTVPNGGPVITSDPSQATVGARRYRYVVKAEDPDGDRPLRYGLVEGPDGMQVDLLSGVVSWKVPGDARGSYPVELSVSDPLGGETRQRYTVEIRWERAPANPR